MQGKREGLATPVRTFDADNETRPQRAQLLHAYNIRTTFDMLRPKISYDELASPLRLDGPLGGCLAVSLKGPNRINEDVVNWRKFCVTDYFRRHSHRLQNRPLAM